MQRRINIVQQSKNFENKVRGKYTNENKLHKINYFKKNNNM